MEYTVDLNDGGLVSILIENARNEIPFLVDEFRKCTTENCVCKTPELEKLEFMKIEGSDDHLEVLFHPKPGASFDLDEIERFVVQILSYAYKADDEILY